MLENEFNGIVSKSLNEQNGYGFKIPDSVSRITLKHSDLPCDGFGIFNGLPLYWESKNLTKPESFNFTRLEEHQINFLIKAYELTKGNCYSFFLINVDFGRGNKKVFAWKNEDLYKIKERKDNKRNILKKEFESRSNFVKISKGQIDFNSLINLPVDNI